MQKTIIFSSRSNSASNSKDKEEKNLSRNKLELTTVENYTQRVSLKIDIAKPEPEMRTDR